MEVADLVLPVFAIIVTGSSGERIAPFSVLNQRVTRFLTRFHCEDVKVGIFISLPLPLLADYSRRMRVIS